MKTLSRRPGSKRTHVSLVPWLIIFFLWISPGLSAETGPTSSDTTLVLKLKQLIPHIMRQKSVPGMTMALARRGEIIWEEGFGYADLKQKIPMTPHSVLRAGSMSKTYLATAVMQLVEKGIIRLDDPVNKHLDAYQLINPMGEREITIQDLLTHTSGLSSSPGGCEFLPPRPLGQHLKEDNDLPMFKSYLRTWIPRWSAKVGEKLIYSNYGIATLGYVVESTNPEGLPFEEYVTKHIFEPLGMASTTFPPFLHPKHVSEPLISRLTKGYATFGSINIRTPSIHIEDYPAGSLLTTSGDHIKLLLAYMNGGEYRGNRILEQETIASMLRPHASWPEMGMDIGLVWMLHNRDSAKENYGHGGAYMYGWSGNFFAYPKQDFAVSIMTNQWPMTDRMDVPDLISEFISIHLEDEARGIMSPSKDHSWAWKTSYVTALLMMDEMKGSLGIESELTGDMIEAMISGAGISPSGLKGRSIWDPDGFRCGIMDMQKVKMTREDISRFINSRKLRVSRAELNILYRELGGRRFPLQ